MHSNHHYHHHHHHQIFFFSCCSKRTKSFVMIPSLQQQQEYYCTQDGEVVGHPQHVNFVTSNSCVVRKQRDDTKVLQKKQQVRIILFQECRAEQSRAEQTVVVGMDMRHVKGKVCKRGVVIDSATVIAVDWPSCCCCCCWFFCNYLSTPPEIWER